ncbi:MAG TPA: molybdenum ABC transporter ATP-binding protein [Steroidobacteraceae bacterium]|nr:molybdenum ABC transporter ATP-binding protein [Steroidobacteraceae bacterium]
MLQVSVVRKRPEFSLAATFTAPTPGVIALFGRSGSGKTTLVNIISGLLAPDSGEVRLGDEVLLDARAGISLPVERRHIGYVFQDARLFPHLSAAGNLHYGEKRARGSPQVVAFDEVIALLGLAPLLGRRPYQLSGGERQRVALGRALLSQPRLLLLDEPLASLDAPRREEVLPYLEALRDRFAIPMVYVSHQFDEVLRLATHLVLLDAGRVLAEGTVNEVSLRPELQSIVGPDLVGAVLDGVVTQVGTASDSALLTVGRGTLQVSLRGVPLGARVRLQILARDVILATRPVQGLSVRNALASTVTAISHDDYGAVLVEVNVGGPTVLARITREALEALKLRPGDAVWTLVKAVSTRGHAYRLA